MRHFLYFNGSVRAACAARTHLLQHWSWLLPSLPTSLFQRFSREGHTRSHSEHGSQASLRRWYLASGPGRVGRRWIHAPHEVNLVGGFFLYRSALRLHSRRHGKLILAACGSQPLELALEGPFFFYTARHNPAGFFCARVSSRTSWDCRGLFIPACHLVRMCCYPF